MLVLRQSERAILHWFCFTSLCDWSKKLVLLSQPIRCKTKTNSDLVVRVFRALDSLAVFTLSSHWLSKIFCFLLIGRCDYFGFGFMTLNRKALHTKCELFANIPVCSSSWWQQCCNYITLEVLSFEKKNKVNQTQVRYKLSDRKMEN